MTKMRVLVIDETLQEAYAGIFGDAANICCVTSGEAAIQVIRNKPSQWDLIISDQRLAGRIPGRDVYLHLVEYHPQLSTKFVFVAADRDELEGLDIASNRVLPKPFERDQIVDLAKGVFQRHGHA